MRAGALGVLAGLRPARLGDAGRGDAFVLRPPAGGDPAAAAAGHAHSGAVGEWPDAGLLADLLRRNGFGPSLLHVLEALGGPRERIRSVSADTGALDDVDPLNLVGIEVAAEPDARIMPLARGLPEALFEHDGQITKARGARGDTWRRWPREPANCCGMSAVAPARSPSSGRCAIPPTAPSASRRGRIVRRGPGAMRWPWASRTCGS